MNKLSIRNTFPIFVFIIGFIHLGLLFVFINLTFHQITPNTITKFEKDTSHLNIVLSQKINKIEPEAIVEFTPDQLTEEALLVHDKNPSKVLVPPQFKPRSIIKKQDIGDRAVVVKQRVPMKTLGTKKEITVSTKQLISDRRKRIIAKYRKLKMTYNQDLEEFLGRHRRFPILARRFGHEGLVRYKVRVERDGSFSRIIKLHSSGHESLDNESLALLRQASGFKPLPQSLPFLTLNVPIEYKLH